MFLIKVIWVFFLLVLFFMSLFIGGTILCLVNISKKIIKKFLTFVLKCDTLRIR